MIRSVFNRRRAERARREIAAFEPTTEEHQRLKLLLIAMLDFMVLVLCRPALEKDFEKAWACVEQFREQMEAAPAAADATSAEDHTQPNDRNQP